jgi:AcrR family transcriptional regulator
VPSTSSKAPSDTTPTIGVRRRADAQRSIAAILDAALACFSRDPDASTTEIARAAGVGRVTLYAHFPSREQLLEAVLARGIAQADEVLAAVPLDDAPADVALVRLIRSSWRVLDRYRSLYAAALEGLGESRLRKHHRAPLARVQALVARGQAEGALRADLPRDWLVTTFYSLLHAAAQEVDAGRLKAAAAPDVLESTLLAAFAPRHE